LHHSCPAKVLTHVRRSPEAASTTTASASRELEIRATKPLANQRDSPSPTRPGAAPAKISATRSPPSTTRAATCRRDLERHRRARLGAIARSRASRDGRQACCSSSSPHRRVRHRVDERDPEKFIDTVARLEPSFGESTRGHQGTECFVMRRLKRDADPCSTRPARHAIVVSAACSMAFGWGKDIGSAKLVASGAAPPRWPAWTYWSTSAAPGEHRRHDIGGVVYEGRNRGDGPYKARYAVRTDAHARRCLDGADVFLGLSPRRAQAEWLPRWRIVR